MKIVRDLSRTGAYDNEIIVESLFRETTRNGRHTIRLVLLALTRNVLTIASSHSLGLTTPRLDRNRQNVVLEIRSLHPLHLLELLIFKKTKRRTLKLCFHNKYVRYFELETSCGTDESWKNWCKNVRRLKREVIRRTSSIKSLNKNTSCDEDIFNKQRESRKVTWNDKYLYLGSKREVEDRSRPTPVKGLGPPEDIKLLYLKPEYFGCWGQAEHWVQCESNE